jgi:hypothetical protein
MRRRRFIGRVENIFSNNWICLIIRSYCTGYGLFGIICSSCIFRWICLDTEEGFDNSAAKLNRVIPFVLLLILPLRVQPLLSPIANHVLKQQQQRKATRTYIMRIFQRRSFILSALACYFSILCYEHIDSFSNECRKPRNSFFRKFLKSIRYNRSNLLILFQHQ